MEIVNIWRDQFEEYERWFIVRANISHKPHIMDPSKALLDAPRFEVKCGSCVTMVDDKGGNMRIIFQEG